MLAYEDIPQELNIASWFLDRNVEEGRGDRVALHCGDSAHTYAELARLTNRVGHVLRDLGVRPEERVLLALTDGVEFVASWFAVLKVGAVVAEVYTFLQEAEYEYYLNYSGAGVVIVDETTRAKIAAVAPRCPRLRCRLVVGARGALEPGEADFERLVSEAPDELRAAPTSRDDVALWKFTTGSTGASKAAVHLQHDPLVSFDHYALGVLGFRPDDVVLPVPKLFFGYGRDLAALFTFGVGAAGVVFPERSTPEVLFDLIERHRPTVMVQVPTMINAMINHPGAKGRDLSSLRLVTSSGEALPEELHRRWLETFGVEVLEGIGSSEAYHIYISNRPGAVRPGSAGQLVPGYRAILADEQGDEVPDGGLGELRIAGESAAVLYWGDHAKSKRTFAGDWIRTGDLFVRDGDGYFWYRGRADDLLKVGGIWVAPLEIENCLLQHEAVAECAVLGYEEDGLQLPRAYVVLREGAGTGADELRDFVRARLSPHKVPRDVRAVGELPKTPSGKVDKRAMREREA